MAHAGEHKPNDFTPVTGAMELANYVLNITDNINKFPDYIEKEVKSEDGTKLVIVQRQDNLVNWVREQAKEIYILTFSANEIDLRKEPWRKEERLGKQARAISLCVEHRAAIQLCRRHFHLSFKKIRYWGKTTCDLQKAIEGWHKSDKIRYKDI